MQRPPPPIAGAGLLIWVHHQPLPPLCQNPFHPSEPFSNRGFCFADFFAVSLPFRAARIQNQTQKDGVQGGRGRFGRRQLASYGSFGWNPFQVGFAFQESKRKTHKKASALKKGKNKHTSPVVFVYAGEWHALGREATRRSLMAPFTTGCSRWVCLFLGDPKWCFAFWFSPFRKRVP